jgi:hypothetical protein
MSVAKESLRMTGLFEAELLIELMLRYWHHPLCNERWFCQQLLENAAEALRESVAGTQLIDGLKPKHMNLVAAAYYAEWSAVSSPQPDAATAVEFREREEWLTAIRRAIPGCFCDPDELV